MKRPRTTTIVLILVLAFTVLTVYVVVKQIERDNEHLERHIRNGNK